MKDFSELKTELKGNFNGVSKKAALKFIVLMGVVSLLADMTYEGARGITGPYLATLGASGTIVGIVAGFGELIAYTLRLFSGYLADRTGQYWLIAFFGYGINLLAVPLLALAGRWEIAAALIVIERMGKALRTPSRDAMLSYASKRVGVGWGFGLHKALDQIGGMTGPLIVAAVFYFKGEYRTGFAVLLVPALLALLVLAAARFLHPNPRDFEGRSAKPKDQTFPKVFWIYLAAVAFICAGYVDFPLIAFHFKKMAVMRDSMIPIVYAVAMGVAALSALVFGRLFDRIGFSVLVAAAALSSLFPLLVFQTDFRLAFLGAVFWGIGMGAQESVMRAALANMISSDKRGSAYGVFNTGYGVFWFLGSAVMGILYDKSLPCLIGFSVTAQLLSIPFFIQVRREIKSVR